MISVARRGRKRGTYLGGTTTSNDPVVLDRPLDNHDGIVQTPLDLGNKLLRTTTQQQRTRLGALAVLENVEPLPANLPLLESATRTEVLVFDIGTGGLDGSADGLDDAFEVVIGHSSGAEDVPVGKVLRSEVSDRQAGKDDFGAGGDDRLEFSIDDLPFGIDDRLVFRHLVDTDLGIVLFGLEFEFDVEAEDTRVGELLWLLFEAGVGKGLFEGDALDEEGVLRSTVSIGNRATSHADVPAYHLREPSSPQSNSHRDPPGRGSSPRQRPSGRRMVSASR